MIQGRKKAGSLGRRFNEKSLIEQELYSTCYEGYYGHLRYNNYYNFSDDYDYYSYCCDRYCYHADIFFANGGTALSLLMPIDEQETMTELEIPAWVSDVDPSMVLDCRSLERIEVDGENEYLTSIDGILYDIDVTRLIRCPIAKETFIIPYGVTEIGFCAFNDCENLTSITIPDSVTKIGYNAFYGCGSLKEIKLHPDDPVIKFNYTVIEVYVSEALDMIRTGDYTKEIPHEQTLILLFQHYLRTKDEKILSYIRSHIDLNKLMKICISGGLVSGVEALTRTDGILTHENIDRYIDLANDLEQREIMLDLIYYKEQRLGFQTPQERLFL